MADDEASLDDFFAKKDRSKRKQKNKLKYADQTSVANTDEDNPQQSNQSKDKSTTQKKDKEKGQSGIAKLSIPIEGDEEWIDFEEKTEKDYSGLRIQNIQITNRVESENEADQREGGDEENGEEGHEKEDTNQGPWNKANIAAVEPSSEPVIAKAQPEQPKATKKYVPPSMRANAARPAAAYKKKKGAPDIKNEEEFPTLGTGPPPDWAAQSKSFEAVRSGGRRVETTQDTLHLTLENQFAALS